MALTYEQQDINKMIVVGDKVLIRVKSAQDRTNSGLFLPPGVEEKEKIHSGYVIKVGPGYALPSIQGEEVWQNEQAPPKYIPLQARAGDLAVYLQRNAYEITFNDEKYVIVPHQAILLLLRDEGLFE